LLAGVVLPTPAIADDGVTLANGSSVQRVSAESLDIDVSGVTTAWRAEEHTDGTVTTIFGPGTARVPVKADTIRVAGSANSLRGTTQVGTRAANSAAAADWYCEARTPPKVTRSGRQLASHAGAYCVGRPGMMRIEYWFDRSSWSGWRQYTRGHRATAWTPAQAQGTEIYTTCGSGGTYNYRARIKINVRGTGGPVFGAGEGYGNSSGRYKCGTHAIA